MKSTWQEGVTKAAQHVFVNGTDEPMRVEWLDYRGTPAVYAAAVAPGESSVQSARP